jgi:uncharacterized membrane protein
MESEHSIDGLRTKLRTLRDSGSQRAHDSKLRKLIDEVKRQETEILAKLSKSGVVL